MKNAVFWDVRQSETSVLTRVTRRNFSEDSIKHYYMLQKIYILRCENLLRSQRFHQNTSRLENTTEQCGLEMTAILKYLQSDNMCCIQSAQRGLIPNDNKISGSFRERCF
jgi:hypothetical protein